MYRDPKLDAIPNKSVVDINRLLPRFGLSIYHGANPCCPLPTSFEYSMYTPFSTRLFLANYVQT